MEQKAVENQSKIKALVSLIQYFIYYNFIQSEDDMFTNIWVHVLTFGNESKQALSLYEGCSKIQL